MSDGLQSGDMRAQIVNALLDACGSSEEVRVLFDARADGVRVPEVLRVGGVWFAYSRHYMNPPIPDLTVDAAGISATLSFSGSPFTTFVPWEAVKIVQAPPHARVRAIGKLTALAVEGLATEKRAEVRSRFRVVSDDEPPPDGDAPAANATEWGPRLVKGGAA